MAKRIIIKSKFNSPTASFSSAKLKVMRNRFMTNHIEGKKSVEPCGHIDIPRLEKMLQTRCSVPYAASGIMRANFIHCNRTNCLHIVIIALEGQCIFSQ